MKCTDRRGDKEEKDVTAWNTLRVHTHKLVDTSRIRCHNDAEEVYKLPVDQSLAFFFWFCCLL